MALQVLVPLLSLAEAAITFGRKPIGPIRANAKSQVAVVLGTSMVRSVDDPSRSVVVLSVELWTCV